MSGQLGIWFAQQLDPQSTAYNVGEYLEIDGDLDIRLFEIALRHTYTEAEALHARFVGEDDDVRQHFPVSDDWPLHIVDLTAHPDARAAAESWMWDDMRKPTPLTGERFFTQALFLVPGNRFFWYQRAHHIVVDGFGGPLLASRTAALYNALLAGDPVGERAWESIDVLLAADDEYRNSSDFTADRDYWLRELADRPDVTGLSGRRATEASGTVHRHLEGVGPDEAALLRQAARKYRTTLSGLLVAGTAAYISAMTGAQDVVLGLPVLGRTGSAARRIPGMTANVLPVRISVSPGAEIADFISHTSDRIRKALRHQRYRYEDIRRDLQLVSDEPLFGPTVNVMSFDYDLRFGNSGVTVHNLSSGMPFNDLSVNVYDRSADGSVKIAFDANADLYEPQEIAEHARRFVRLLLDIATADAGVVVGGIG
ncbi:condensation domain-containing protein, partial [Streptomyces sp. NPDC053079]|uniref:condensation domain-containing protein n=1 Tax=Streptomyces sp. NPDC053079 TaxID=3365697 RepID=UPI0037D5E751